MSTERNGNDPSFQEVADKIMEGTAVKIAAFDADPDERASVELKDFIRQFKGSITFYSEPHSTKAGSVLNISVNALPWRLRKTVIEKIAASPLTFEIVRPKT